MDEDNDENENEEEGHSEEDMTPERIPVDIPSINLPKPSSSRPLLAPSVVQRSQNAADDDSVTGIWDLSNTSSNCLTTISTESDTGPDTSLASRTQVNAKQPLQVDDSETESESDEEPSRMGTHRQFLICEAAPIVHDFDSYFQPRKLRRIQSQNPNPSLRSI